MKVIYTSVKRAWEVRPAMYISHPSCLRIAIHTRQVISASRWILHIWKPQLAASTLRLIRCVNALYFAWPYYHSRNIFLYVSSLERSISLEHYTFCNVLVLQYPLTICPVDPDHQMRHTEDFWACSLQGSYWYDWVKIKESALVSAWEWHQNLPAQIILFEMLVRDFGVTPRLFFNLKTQWIDLFLRPSASLCYFKRNVNNVTSLEN